MKIEVEIPDFPEDELRAIRIMFGIEERALKMPGEPWKIKVTQCNRCGKCCMVVADNWKFGKAEHGGCALLEYSEGWDGWICKWWAARPFSCCVGDEVGKEHCSIKWKELLS